MILRGMVGLGCALAAGCLNIPPHNSDVSGDGPSGDGPRGDGGTLPAVVVTSDQNGHDLVETDVMTLRFENEGWLMPESLMFTRDPLEEWLAVGTDIYNEQAIGISAFPGFSINCRTELGAAESRTVIERGPVRGIVEVAWRGPPICPAATTAPPVSHSRFTFYPDGRIVRRDTVDTTESCVDVSVGATNGFDPSNVTDVAWSFADGGIGHGSATDGMVAASVRPNRGWMCLSGGGNAIAMTWDPSPANGWLAVETRRFATLDSMSFFFTEQQTPDDTTIANHQYIARTALFFRDDATTCEALGEAIVPAYQQPPELDDAGFDHDGGGYQLGAGGAYQAEATIGPGFAVVFATPQQDLLVSRTSSEAGRTRELVLGVDYQRQRTPDDNSFVLWMVDELREDETLHIEGR
jgi:hypothetical protein